MEFFKTDSQLLSERLDPGHYSPILIENEEKINRFGSEHLKSQYRDSGIGHTAAVTPHYTSDPNGIPYISGGCIIDGHLEFGNADRINILAHANIMGGSRLEPGFILFVRKGELGNSAVVPENIEVNCSSEVVFLKPKPEVDSHFVSAYLNSRHGRMAFLRQQRGMMITSISLYDVPEIPIIKMDFSAKKYIGDKVRQAERLRAWAKAERVKIDLYFDSILNGIYQERPERCFSRISNEILVPRLNAEFYAPEFVSVEIGLRQKFGKLTTIGKLAPTIRSKEKPRGDCRYFEIGDLSTSKGTFEQGSYYKKGEAPNNAQRKFDIGDVAVSTRRPNRGAIAVVEDGDVNNFYSVFLARLKPKNISFGYWLKEFLRHEIGKLLLQQRCTWTTYPVISEDDLETIPVPVIEGDWEYISNLSKQSVLLEYHSKQLSNSAKLLVEDLIEGQITEAQLIAAEQALQAGNDALDRKILGRLKTDGIDGDGAALFSDLDELYRLLALAEVE